ncbi:Sensor histidine kinase TmoS [Rosistilla ulvae]|uniref:histidine kinase n=1 Tax=Rosistilla ulvae TaxID=1930277 RepID=A0A517M563_9BACT|nr:PAS domain S-box protein [Rosistilla ulvae]QDS90009.1 Sensor histidine kinase TmoS [Rosistilla ulvae]
MARRTRDFDWSQTPVGPIERWPAALKTAVQIMLGSRYAMWLGWGPDFTFFYNDAYAQMTLGPKHPAAFGKPARDVWSEIWDDVGPRAEKVLRTGEATWDEGLLLFLQRSGFPEETYHTFSYSPLPGDDGTVDGMLCVVTEDTQRTIGERRLKTLRELAAGTTDTLRNAADACERAAEILGNNLRDLPFSLIYLLDSDQRFAHLHGTAGLPPDEIIAPASIDLTNNPTPWPLANVSDSGTPVHVDALPDRLHELNVGIWPEPPTGAVVLPLARPGQHQMDGFLVAGISPRLPFEDRYRGFFDLLAGQLVTVVANAKAYEEERRRSDALAELDRAKTAFFSNVSHEFRTPLTLILGPVGDMLNRSGPEEISPQIKRDLEIVNRNGMRLLRLVNSLLDFSRLEAGRAEAHFRPLDLAKLTSELASVFRSAMENAGLEYHVDCRRIRQAVFVDFDLWEKIVLNLLSNAHKYTLKGKVSILLDETDDGVRLRVSDTGSGIPAEHLAKIFDRFHRIEGTVGRSHEGSGIGLALVHDLVQMHGGTIEVESQLGVGSVFTIRLPRGKAHLPSDQVVDSPADSPGDMPATRLAVSIVDEALRWLPHQATHASAASHDGNNQNEFAETSPSSRSDKPVILVADDNADMLSYVSRLLASHYRVVSVSDGQQALERIKVQPPDLILSDVMMPRLGGGELLEQVREDRELADIPFILLSARAGEESCVEGLRSGADDYLIKPFTARELLARVEAHLKIAKLRGEATRLAKESEARLTIALAAARMFVWDWNLESGEVTLSENCTEVLPKFLQQTRFASVSDVFELVHPEDVDRVRATIDQAVESGSEFEIQFRCLNEEGEIAWLEDRGQVISDEHGNPVRMLGVVVDVTEQKHSQESLHQRERFLQAIFDATPECIKLVAADGTLVQMNTAGLQMVEADKESDVVGQSVWGIIAAEHRDAFRNFNEDICRGRRGILEFDIVGKSGTRRQMETHAVPLPLDDGRTVQLAVTRDVTERKQAEAAMREREAAFRGMADNAPAMLWVTDPKGHCTFISRGWCEFTGQTADEGLGTGWLRAVHPDDRESSGKIFQHANENRQPFTIDYRVLTADGEYRWAIDMGRPHFDSNHNFLGFIGSVTDNHQRKTAQDFRLSQARVLEMINNHRPLREVLTEVVYFLERQIDGGLGSILLLDENCERMRLGAAPHLADAYNQAIDGIRIGEGQGSCGTAAHRRATVLVEDIQSDPLWTNFRDLAAVHGIAGACWSEPILLGDGTLLGTLAVYFPVPRTAREEEFAAMQQLAGFAAIAIERYRAHKAIHESEQRFRILADNMSQLAWTCDAFGEVNWFNQRWYDYTGRSFEEMRGWGWTKVLQAEHRARVVDGVERARNREDVWEDTFPMLGANGEYRWFLSRAVPIRGEQGKVLRWFGTNTDVTELRDVQQLLRDADQRKDEFLAMLAHELRNPLAPIRSGLDLLAMEPEHPQNDMIKMMQDQVDHVVRLVDDLLDVARIMRGKVELRREPVELAPLVRQSVDAVRPAIDSHQHELTVSLPNRSVWLDADPVRIVQVIENLLGNAAKYMEAGGNIQLSVDPHDDRVSICVRDEGIGIDAELLPRVFQLFTQSSRSLDRSQGGLGIGLTLVKQLVELHGGTVMVESEGIGHGSQFTVTLPTGKVSAQQSEESPDQHQLSKVRRIVLVDDNRSAVFLLDRLLKKFGKHEIHHASDGPSALELIRKEHPEIVLLDIGLPGLDGFQVAEAIRQEGKFDDILMIALTGYGHEEARQRCERVGFDEHLVKPPSVDQIKKILSHCKLR